MKNDSYEKRSGIMLLFKNFVLKPNSVDFRTGDYKPRLRSTFNDLVLLELNILTLCIFYTINFVSKVKDVVIAFITVCANCSKI